jgi:hypothetical protein
MAPGYRVEFRGKSICYITDTEHRGGPDKTIVELCRSRPDDHIELHQTPSIAIAAGAIDLAGGHARGGRRGRRHARRHHDPSHDDAFWTAWRARWRWPGRGQRRTACRARSSPMKG